MRIEETIINVIFDVGQGKGAPFSREATVGKPYGSLPAPTRNGYRFVGWFLGEERILPETVVTAEQDVTLSARWEKEKKTAAAPKHPTMLRRQKGAIALLSAVAVLLLLVLIGVNYIVSIYGVEDISYTADGEKIVTQYQVRKKGGVYALYDKNGQKMPTNSDGYYLAASGNQYDVDADTGSYKLYARVDYEDAETGALVTRILLFPQITQENVYSIEVRNAAGGYTFYREEDGDVQIRGLEGTLIAYNDDQYARLCVSCGYTLALVKLDLKSAETPRRADGSVNYDVYGLEDRFDAEGNKIYSPTEYTITQADTALLKSGVCRPSETSYTLRIGDKIPSESGYYVRVVGRDAIYVLSTDLGETLFGSVETMVTPQVTSPVELNTFTNIYDFALGKTSLTGIDWGALGEKELAQELEKLDIEEIVAFSFRPLPERSHTIFSPIPYESDLDLMKGYRIYNNKVSEALENLYDIALRDCKRVGLTPEAFAEYGLSEDITILTYLSPMKRVNDDGSETQGFMRNTLLISAKTKDDTYFVASMLYNMIVEVEARSLNFIEWDANDWYAKNPVELDVNYLKEWSMTILGKTYDFVLDNRLSYAYYYDSEGTPTLLQGARGTLGKSGSEWAFRDAGGTVRKIHYMDFENGTFYQDSNSNIVYRISEGKELTVSPNAKRMLVYCAQYTGNVPNDPTLIQYEIVREYVNDRGEETSENVTELQNFFRLYQWMTSLSVNGVVDDAEFYEAKGMTVSEYLAVHGDAPTAVIRYKYEDLAAALNRFHVTKEDGTTEKLYPENNAGEVVIRFYEYTTRKSLMTIEVVSEYDGNGNPILHPEKAEGRFYVLSSALEGILNNAEKFLGKQPVELPS